MSNSSKDMIEFVVVYNRHKAKLYNYAIKMINDRTACEDLVQNVFVKLFENFARLQNKESVQSWLFTTARNEIFTYYRKKKIHVDQFYVDDVDEIDVEEKTKVDEEYEQKELKEMVMNELEKMPLAQREVFLLKEFGGLSYKEIASVTNIDEELVKSRLFNTRRKLMAIFSRIFLKEREL